MMIMEEKKQNHLLTKNARIIIEARKRLPLHKKYLIIKYGTEGKREEPRGQTTHITDERVLLQGRGRPYPRA